jgi:pilus assembly protein CpaB
MNMRKVLMGIIVAFVISGSLVFVLYKKIQAGNNSAAKVTHVWHYYAANRNIAAGESLSATMIAPVDWSSPVPVDGAISESDKALGRIAAYPVANGMVITERMLASAGSSYGLPQKIPDGMRAIAIKTDDVADLGGFLFPGAHVDVLLTLGGGGAAVMGARGGGGERTVVVLENTEVLSTGKQMVADPSDKPTVVSVVNLLVSADDARKIALAESQGSVHLALRNSADGGNSTHKVTYLGEITGDPTLFHAAAIRDALKPPPPQELQMILGAKSYTETYRDNIPVGETVTLPGGGLRK